MKMVTTPVQIENVNKAIELAESKGWSLDRIRMLTDNKAGDYLMVTLSKVHENEWGVHLYNSKLDGFYEGYYTDNRFDAIDKYWDK